MNIVFRSLIAASLVATLGACSYASPDAGQEAVLVQKPWFFGSGGIVSEPVTTGRTFVAPSTDVIIVNVTPIEFKEAFEDLMSSDGVPLDFDSYMRLKVNDSVKLIDKFGPKWYPNNIRAQYRNFVRQSVRGYGLNETAISSEAVEKIDAEVTKKMQAYVKSQGIPITVIEVNVGKANPPDSVKNQRIETARQQQRQQTEQDRKLAEDQRKAAEESRAAADKAYQQAMGLSAQQFVELEGIAAFKDVCIRKGAGCKVITGSASAVMPIK